MKAVCWMGKHDVRVEDIPEPQILSPTDAIIRVSSTAICGSDLHLYNGFVPSMKEYDVLGHEFMGHVVEVGPSVKNLKVGDRVLVPCQIACGACSFCQTDQFSLCDNSNPNGGQMENVYGHAGGAIYGYSHLFGGYDGGQAQYVRVPYADVSPVVLRNDLPDEKLLFLTDILPTGWQAAEQAGVGPGQVVAVWGCGPVGLFTIASAMLLGAEQVIAIDREPERLEKARNVLGATTIDFENEHQNVLEELLVLTGGRGPDVCIDAVGMEALGHGMGAMIDWTKQVLRMQSDRPNVLRQCITACRKGGTVSIPGVYGGIVDGLNLGAAFNKGLTFRMGQTHVKKHLPKLIPLVESGELDPSFIITHSVTLDDAPEMYETFKLKQDDCVKVVMRPFAA